MAITVSGTSITFNDSTTQTTAAVAGVTSAVAGNGVAVSGATGAVTFSQACPTANSVGSYALMYTPAYSGPRIQGTNYTDLTQFPMAMGNVGCQDYAFLAVTGGATTLSGTWKWMSPSYTGNGYQWGGLACRVA